MKVLTAIIGVLSPPLVILTHRTMNDSTAFLR